MILNDTQRYEKVLNDMTESEQTEIFSSNLKKYMTGRNLTQVEVAEAIDVSPQVFSTWMIGRNLPRMDKVKKLAEYFGVSVGDLVNKDTGKTREDILEAAFSDRPEMRMLLDAVKDCTPEEILQIVKIVKALRG